jgi:hypothetical protein
MYLPLDLIIGLFEPLLLCVASGGWLILVPALMPYPVSPLPKLYPAFGLAFGLRRASGCRAGVTRRCGNGVLMIVVLLLCKFASPMPTCAPLGHRCRWLDGVCAGPFSMQPVIGISISLF